MVISHKFKFIFIKTAKTAGTSIEVFLSRHCGPDDILTPIVPPLKPHRARNYADQGFSNHMTAREVRTVVSSEIWDNYFKFCVERNPWDKTLSHYHMMKYRAGGTLTLEEYFSRGRFSQNIEKYTDSAGNVMLDKVAKYENLDRELSDIFRCLGIPFSGTLLEKAKSEYRKDRRHYRTVFTAEQSQMIAELFEAEIAMHGYHF